MNKQEFLARLKEGLNGLPREDIGERLAFYGEMIDDRVEEGLSEEEAIAEIGPVDAVVSQTLEEVPIAKLVKERVKPKRRLRAWEVVLIVLGSPVWVPLLIAVLAIFFSIYVVIWSVIISIWAVVLSLAVSALAALAFGIWFLFRGRVLQGLALTGAGIILAGLSIFLFFGCLLLTKGAVALTKRIALGMKSLFLRKENSK